MNGNFWVFMVVGLLFQLFGQGDGRRMFMLLRSL